jgi:hypothetical protein
MLQKTSPNLMPRLSCPGTPANLIFAGTYDIFRTLEFPAAVFSTLKGPTPTLV